MAYLEKYKQWVNDEYFDEATRAELKSIENNDNEIKERFLKIWSLVLVDYEVSWELEQTE